MTWLGVPWMVGGGAEHQAEIGRALAYAQSNGGEGVGSYLDCKVMASTVADNQIHVQPGVVTMLNRYGGGVRQSYVGLCQEQTNDTVPSTTSSGSRSDLVVARVVDQQYGGAAPADLQDGPYMFTEIIANVPSTTKRFSQLGLAYPAVELARIDRPSSTATVAQSQIVDLRRLTRPRREKFTARYVTQNGSAPGTGAGQSEFYIKNTETGWKDFHTFSPIPVPEWAGRMVVTAPITSMGFSGGTEYVEFLIMFGATGMIIDSQTGVADVNNAGNAYGDLANQDILVADDITIPAGWRGIDIFAVFKGRSLNDQTTGDAMSWRSTAIRLEVEFFESI